VPTRLELHLQSILLWLFGDDVFCTVFLGWPQTEILPVSDSQIARVIGVSIQHMAYIKPIFILYISSFMDTKRISIHLLYLELNLFLVPEIWNGGNLVQLCVVHSF
jgi:hypothetical protein